MSWQDAYARPGTRFGIVDIEHPGGHHGQDFPLPDGGGSPVYAYEECTVVESGVEVTRGFTSIMGWYLVARAKSDGRYIGWAHLRRGTRASVGDVLRPGDVVGLAASGPRPKDGLAPAVAGVNYPGTAWTAPHVHTTLSTTIPGIFAGPTYDPLPRIQASLSSLANTGPLKPVVVTKPVPLPTPAPKKREPAMHVLVSNIQQTGVFGIITAAGTRENLTGNGARMRVWVKAIADQRGIKPEDVKPIEISGEEWIAFGF